MKKKQSNDTKRRLLLSKEKVRPLQQDELEKVVGGQGDACANTYTAAPTA